MSRLDENEFNETVLDPAAWELSATSLLATARPLRSTVGRFLDEARKGNWAGAAYHDAHVYFMLAAFAIENLLKARIVQARGAQLKKELQLTPGVLPKLLKSHRLWKLAVSAEMKAFADEERRRFDHLERASIWFGRYPVPVAASDFGMSKGIESDDLEWIDRTVKTILSEIQRDERALTLDDVGDPIP